MTGNFWSLRLEHRNSWRRQKQLWICGIIMFFFLASFNKSVSLILLVAFPPRDHIWFIYIEKNVRLLYQVATNCSDNSDPKVVSQPKKSTVYSPPDIAQPSSVHPLRRSRSPPQRRPSWKGDGRLLSWVFPSAWHRPPTRRCGSVERGE